MLCVIPFYSGDRDLAVKLSAWINEIDTYPNHELLVVRDARCEPIPDLGKTFGKIHQIEIVDDVWNKWPESCNNVINKAARHIENVIKQPWLFLEPDSVPMRKAWLDELEAEYNACRKPFMGDKVSVGSIPVHCSGVAIYPPDMCNHAGSIYWATDTAWDMVAAPQIVPKMHDTRLILHAWSHPKFESIEQVRSEIGKEVVLFHADKAFSIVPLLRAETADLARPAQQNAVQVNVGAVTGTVVDIFIKTYPKDQRWVWYCLRSINKFAKPFRDSIIILPPGSMGGDLGYKLIQAPEYGDDGYLSQQVFKMHADTFTDADYILHIDSDTIFTRPVTPETYFQDGKPIIMITPIDQAHPDEQQAWRKVMHKFMGKPSEYEFMRRFPLVYPRWAYGALRGFCEEKHGMPLDKYIMSQPYREFSEFNVMGFYLWEFHRDKFTWIDTSKIPENEWPELTVDQRWSHDPIPVKEWEKILGGSGVAADEKQIPSTGGETLSSQSKLEKLRANAAKARAAKAAKRKAGDAQLNQPVSTTSNGESKVQSSDSPNGVIPWNDKIASLGEINKLCTRLKQFCDAPMHIKRVRDELRSTGVIR